jgi:hypothetical protein
MSMRWKGSICKCGWTFIVHLVRGYSAPGGCPRNHGVNNNGRAIAVWCSPLLVTERQAGIGFDQRKLRFERCHRDDLIQTGDLARLRGKGASLTQPFPYLRLALRKHKIGFEAWES